MIFIEDLTVLFAMFSATSKILLTYPDLTQFDLKHEWASASLFTVLNSLVDLEAKGVLKDAQNDGIKALYLLQQYCARITPQDKINYENYFNSTKQGQSESVTKYIPRFRDAKLLAKSVGVTYSQTQIIDKFLNSLHRSTLYASSILNFQTQRRNEELTAGYSNAALTLSEIEMSLLSLDENNSGRQNAHSVHTRFKQRTNNKNKESQQKTSPFRQQQNKQQSDKLSCGCFICGDPNH